jgi:hypothetical protein
MHMYCLTSLDFHQDTDSELVSPVNPFNAKRQAGKQQVPPFNVFWYDATGDRTRDLPHSGPTLYPLCHEAGSLTGDFSLTGVCLLPGGCSLSGEFALILTANLSVL